VWENRFKGDRGADCLVTVDGTDCRIPEYGSTFYSFKFRKSALRYEVALCIQTGDIVWINGPYEAGLWNDIKIFRDGLLAMLSPNKRVEADDGYVGEAPCYVKCPKSFTNPPETEAMQQRIRNRQETVNARFKQWGVLKQVFRHKDNIGSHGDCFAAVVVITQASINNGDRLFDVRYCDHPEYNF
jgi:hypothetical protein